MPALGIREARNGLHFTAHFAERGPSSPSGRPNLTTKGIAYREGNDLDIDGVIELYRASTLGERRPVGDRERMALMLRNSNLVITAWDGGRLVGISRTLTDFTYAAYLADLAVHGEHQRRGIGLRLIEETRARLGKDSKIVLLAAPKAADYYPRIGFTPHDSAWLLRASDPFPPD